MTRTRIALAVSTAFAAALALLLGGVLGGDGQAGAPAPRARPDAAAGQLLAGFAAGDTQAYVADLEARVAARPGDAESLALLGLAYQQRARETGDPSFYGLSERALRRALARPGDRVVPTTGLAALAAARHRFRDARRLAADAVRTDPESAAAWGILGDALVELGRYEEAFAAFDRMAALKPGLASYARISYARELLGDVEGALAAMRLAVEAGSGYPENAAWTLVQLGNLHAGAGRLEPAAAAYRRALDRLPGYVHAQAGLARVEAARGRYERAARLYRAALETTPLPEFAVGLGDTLAAGGRAGEAREAYELVAVMQRLLEANGVRTELETALFDLDHDRDVDFALARAREAYATRRSIEAEDVLAWGLYKAGECAEARRHSVRALRLGTRDALKLFHRGMIERCLGHEPAGRAYLRRALSVNPNFSLLHAPTAREALQ